MSSYNQISEERTLAETLGLATTEILALYDEMADLCSTIAAQFPDTYDSISKYRQAYRALTALEEAKTVLEAPLERIDPPYRNAKVTVTVGSQTRPRRASSRRVRLGNAVVRLRGVTLAEVGEELQEGLDSIILELEDVSFPQPYG